MYLEILGSRLGSLFLYKWFNSDAITFAKLYLSKTYQVTEKERKKLYNERIMLVEHGSFTLIVKSATGSIVSQRQRFCTWISEMASEKRMWIINKYSLFLIKPVGLCFRKSRSVYLSDYFEKYINDKEHMNEVKSSKVNFGKTLI